MVPDHLQRSSRALTGAESLHSVEMGDELQPQPTRSRWRWALLACCVVVVIAGAAKRYSDLGPPRATDRPQRPPPKRLRLQQPPRWGGVSAPGNRRRSPLWALCRASHPERRRTTPLLPSSDPARGPAQVAMVQFANTACPPLRTRPRGGGASKSQPRATVAGRPIYLGERKPAIPTCRD
jgi:hypothetical protein